MDSHVTIASLPVGRAERDALVAAANAAFETVLGRIEPSNAELTRSLWDAGHYIDHHFLKADMLPMTIGHAAYLIEASLVHHVVDLAVEADMLAANPPVLS